MYELKNIRAKVINVNTRPEFCGDEKTLGCDIKISIETDNTVLDMFDKELRPMLFKEKPHDQRDLVEQTHDEVLTVLRCPHIDNKIKIDYQGIGYRVHIPVGISGDSDIYLSQCEVDKFVADCKEGGTVVLTHRIKCKPTAEETGEINGLLTLESIDISIKPPTPEERAQMELEELGGEDDDDVFTRARAMLDDIHGPFKVSYVERVLGIDYGQAHKICSTLEDNGFIEVDDDGQYWVAGTMPDGDEEEAEEVEAE